MHSLINLYRQIDECEKCSDLDFLNRVNDRLEKRTINSFLKKYNYRVPDKVKFLFVAESTPKIKEIEMYSFYNFEHPPGPLKQHIFKWLSIFDEEFGTIFEKYGYNSIETMNCFLKNCFFTDVIKCVTLKDKKNQKKYEKATNRCLNYLEEEIRLLNPQVIIAISKTAWYGVANAINRLYKSPVLNPQAKLIEATTKTVTNRESKIRVIGLTFPRGKRQNLK